MQYIVRIPSFKKAEYIQFVHQYTTPPKAYTPTYPCKIQPLILIITPAILEICESILHWTATKSKSKCEPGGILITSPCSLVI
jgi:hypothetical protein